MTITRIALAKAQALPSTIDARLAKIRKASLTRQKKSRDPWCCFNFSFCVSIAIILWSVARKAQKHGYPRQLNKQPAEAALRGACLFLTLLVRSYRLRRSLL